MQIFKYGICLNSLTEEDLETVRVWRNSDLVRPYMQFNEIISSEAQVKWFKQINQSTNFYFVIEYNQKKIGLINIKNIDWNKREGEAGIFIGEHEFIDNLAPVLATISLMDFAFETLRLKKLKAKIAVDNIKVIAFNKMLGYQLMKETKDQKFQYYTVSQVDYLKAIMIFQGTLDKLNQNMRLVCNEGEKKFLSSL